MIIDELLILASLLFVHFNYLLLAIRIKQFIFKFHPFPIIIYFIIFLNYYLVILINHHYFFFLLLLLNLHHL